MSVSYRSAVMLCFCTPFAYRYQAHIYKMRCVKQAAVSGRDFAPAMLTCGGYFERIIYAPPNRMATAAAMMMMMMVLEGR